MDTRKGNPSSSRSASKRKTVVIVVASIAISLVAAAIFISGPKIDKGSLDIGNVTNGAFVRDVRAPGLLVAKEIRWLNAQSDATVDEIILRPGATVVPSTLIMQLSNPDVVDKASEAELAFDAAKADSQAHKMSLQEEVLDQGLSLAKVKADLELAEFQASAEKTASEAGVISRLQQKKSQAAAEQLRLQLNLEKQRMEYAAETLSARLGADRSQLLQLKGAMDLAQRTKSALALQAGVSGVLQSVLVQEGQRVLMGTPLAQVAKPGALRAELQVAESRVKDIAVGQLAEIDIKDGKAKGRITRIDPSIKNGTVLVEVEFDQSLPPSARPDLNVEGRIVVDQVYGVTMVARPVGSMPNSTYTGFKVLPNGSQAVRVQIHFGRATIEKIEILSGVKAGDVIVLSDVAQLVQHKSLDLK